MFGFLKKAFVKKGLQEDLAQVLTPRYIEGRPAVWKSDLQEAVRHYHGWVYAAIRPITQGVVRSKLRFFIRREDGSVEELPFNHPMVELFRRVNNSMTLGDLLANTVLFLELTGNAYWSLSKDPSGKPTEIWPLPAHKVQVVPGKDRWVEKYILRNNNRKQEFSAENVVHFRYASPDDLYYGKSPLQAAAEAVDADEGIALSQYRLFAEGLLPSIYVLRTEQRLTPEQAQKLRDDFTNAFRGANKSQRLVIAHSGINLDVVTTKPREMDFLESSRVTRQRILGIFGVPEFLVGIPEGTNRASARVAEYVFAKYTVQPILDYIASVITERICPMFDENAYAEFDSPLPPDPEMEKAKHERVVMLYQAGIITKAEARQALGYSRTPPIEEEEEEAEETKSIEKQLGEGDVDLLVEFLYSPSAEVVIFDRLVAPLIEAAFKQGASLEARRYKMKFDDQRPEVKRALMERSRERWDETVGATTVEHLKRELVEAFEAHETPVQIQERIRRLFTETYRGRAITIARTEIVSAANAGALEAGRQAGATKKRWIATIDERTRPTHLAADGQVVGIDDYFVVGGALLRYPGDPAGPPKEIINCRCSMTTLVEEEQKFYDECDKAFRAFEWELEQKLVDAVMAYFQGAYERVIERLQQAEERGWL